jgi:hypothetical protein
MTPTEPTPDDATDERLSALVRRATLPPVPPHLGERVRRRVRQRQRQWRLAVGTTCAAAAAAVALVLFRPSPADPVALVDGLSEARALVAAPPPVDRLAVLARQQDAYLAALEQLQEE